MTTPISAGCGSFNDVSLQERVGLAVFDSPCSTVSLSREQSMSERFAIVSFMFASLLAVFFS